CCVPPGASRTVPGVTVTLATRSSTRTFAVPLTPSDVAVIVVVPAATAVTVVDAPDVGLTDATAADPLDHVTCRPVSTAPSAARSVTVSGAVSPVNSVVSAGATVTDATGFSATVTVAVPLTP